jgi:hypothetical protein
MGDTSVATQKWYSVRCVFELVGHAGPGETSYEERITMWRAADFGEAILLAEAEAAQYADEADLRYLGLAQAYRMYDVPGHGSEAYSLIRDSRLTAPEYLTAFFDTGAERQG